MANTSFGWVSLCTGLLLVATSALPAAAHDARTVFKAGFAERDISPAIGMEQPGGYGKAYHQAFHDACKARAVVFDDGKTRVAIVGIDALFIRRQTVQAVRSAIKKRCGIEPGSILISASHTHSGGPIGYYLPSEFDDASPLVKSLVYDRTVCANPEYLAKVEKGIVEAVCMADARRTAARGGLGYGLEDKVAFNSWFLRSRLGRHDRKRQNLGPSEDPHRDLDSHALLGEQPVQVIDAADGVPIKAEDQVALLQSRPLRGSTGIETDHQHAAAALGTFPVPEARGQGHGLDGDANAGTPHSAIADQAAGDKLGRVDRDREADPLCRQDHGRVDADDVAAGIDERTTRVARVQGRVGLEHVVNEPARPGAERSAQGTDNTGGHRALEAVRMANRQRELSDAHLLRVAQRGRDEITRVHADHGEVGLRIVADPVRPVLVAVGQGHVELVGPVHHVAVGQDVPARGEHEPGAAAPAGSAPSRFRMTRLDVNH